MNKNDIEKFNQLCIPYDQIVYDIAEGVTSVKVKMRDQEVSIASFGDKSIKIESRSRYHQNNQSIEISFNDYEEMVTLFQAMSKFVFYRQQLEK